MRDPCEDEIMEKEFKLKGDYIKLEQLLKVVGILDKGGQAKVYLTSNPVDVNGHNENRRGAKIHRGDVVKAEGVTIKVH